MNTTSDVAKNAPDMLSKCIDISIDGTASPAINDNTAINGNVNINFSILIPLVILSIAYRTIVGWISAHQRYVSITHTSDIDLVWMTVYFTKGLDGPRL